MIRLPSKFRATCTYKTFNLPAAVVCAIIIFCLGALFFVMTSTVAAAGTTCTSVSQYGIGWMLDKAYPCGQFANGDWWVVPNAGDAGVKIISITPGYASGRNGWEVNPTSHGTQGLDSRITEGRIAGATWDPARIPALPYTATANQSIVKVISRTTSDSPCRPCLQTAAVLTVLGSVPENNGADFFRPPYVGNDKPLYRVSTLQTQLLPNFAPVADMPTLSQIYERFKKVQLDHRDSSGSVNTRPTENYGNDPNEYYGPNVSRSLGDGVLRLMINDPLNMSDPNNERRKALIAYVQTGIEHYHFMLNGQRWGSGDGEQPGMKMPVTFAAAMLNDQGMKDAVRNIPMYDEQDAVSVGEGGRALYGAPIAWTNNPDWEYGENNYWSVLRGQGGVRTLADPYGYIDGGEEPGAVYQDCCTSVVFKGTALSLKLMPTLYDIWPMKTLSDYSERWVTFGTWSQPDPCAPLSQGGGPLPRNWQSGEKPKCVIDPDWDTVNNKCKTGAECGRFPSNHNKNADNSDSLAGGGSGVSSRYSYFQRAMWNAYWGSSPSPDTQAPTVSLTAPAAGATLTGTTNITANASDNVAVSKVEFYQGTTKLGEDTISPYSYSWDTTTVSNGSYSLTAKASDAAGNTATSSPAVSVNVNNAAPPPPPAATSTIWAPSAVPANPNDPDTGAVELGTKFRSDATGNVTGVRFYKGSQNTGTHTGSLWSSTGTRLATVTFTGETASGWQQANFAAPVAISANTTYIISYYAPNGHYAGDNGYFANQSVDNPPLHALKDGTDGSNGVYLYGGGFPNNSYNSSNYWVDVVFSTGTTPADTTSPTFPSGAVLTATPVSSTQINLSWPAASDNVGVTGYTIFRNGGIIAHVGASTTSYQNTGLAASTPYTYSIQARDAANNVSNNLSASATTAAPPPDTTPPSTPTLTATAASSSQINLTWTASTDASGIKGYNVYRGTSPTTITNKLNSSLITTTSLGDTGLSAGTTYYYQVEAVDGVDNTAKSVAASATTQTATAGCTQSATTANFVSVFNSAGAGAVICLSAGDYGTFNGSIKPGIVTIKPASGVAQSAVTMKINFNPASNITIDGVTITYGEIMNASTKNITIKNSDFPGQIVLWNDSLVNSNITLDNNVHHDFDASATSTPWREGRIFLPNRSETQPNGITIKNSKFLRGNSDGIQNGGNGTQILNNEFSGIVQVDSSAGVHADSIQLVGAKNTVIRGNYFHDVEDGIMCADTCDHETVEDNVFAVNGSPFAVTWLSDNGSIIRHNTFVDGACSFDLRCGILYLGNKSSDPPSQGTILKDNILSQAEIFNGSGTVKGLAEDDFNLYAVKKGTGANNILGIPTYVGGANPTTYAGFALAAGSLGKANASDGLDRGARFGSTPPPPTDTEPPTVAISSPANNATVSGTVTVTASASDNVGVAGVQFKLDGVNAGSEDTISPYNYSLDTLTLSNGNHTITAVARDTASPANTSTAVITVNVNNQDTQAPTAPTNLRTTSVASTSVVLAWNASTDNVRVAKYDVLRNGVVIASPTGLTYTDNNVTASTTYSYVVRAADAAGNLSPNSSTLSVTTPSAASIVLLGIQTVNPNIDTDPAGTAEAFRYTASASGTARFLKLYIASGTTATSVKVGIYSNNAGHPGSLLASGTMTAPTINAWNTATLSTNPSLTSGTIYWIGFLGTGGQLSYRDLSTGSCSESPASSNLTSLPSTWTTGQTFPSCKASAYVTK